MRPKSPKLLDDIGIAAEFIFAFIDGKSFSDYERDMLVWSAVERQFTIIGEALTRLRSADPDVPNEITEHQKIIGFRHRLAHGYDEDIDDVEVWQSSNRRFQSSKPRSEGFWRQLTSHNKAGGAIPRPLCRC